LPKSWMLFTRKRSDFLDFAVTINGIVIPRTFSIVFLGVHFDSKFKEKDHINYLVSKGKLITNIIFVLAGTKWGSHPRLTLT